MRRRLKAVIIGISVYLIFNSIIGLWNYYRFFRPMCAMRQTTTAMNGSVGGTSGLMEAVLPAADTVCVGVLGATLQSMRATDTIVLTVIVAGGVAAGYYRITA